MTFPHVAYESVVLYGDDYFAEVSRAAGSIEDVHQSIMHILSQYLRLTHMTPALIAQRKF